MADTLDVIVQRMIDSDEPEENIAAVIQAHKNQPKPNSGVNKPIKSPSSWGAGVLDSITSGEAATAGLKGLAGWGKGAIVDLIPDAAKGLYQLGKVANFSNPVEQAQAAYEGGKGLMEMPSHMYDTTMKAGSKPFEFGEMMGQLTGQPIAGEGLGLAASRIPVAKTVRAAGKGVKAVGSVVEKHTPVSKLIPPVTRPEIVPAIERAAGKGITKIGDSMTKTGLPKVLQNSDYGPTSFTPNGSLKSPTGPQKGSVTYPELNDTPPSLVPNSAAGADEFIPGGKSVTGPNKGSVAYPELNETPPSLMQNSDYGPVEFTPDQPLTAPNNRGGMSYPEMNDTPPSLMQNNQYGPTDEFVNSVMAPTGESRGGVAFPEMSMRPEDLVMNHEYGPNNWTPDTPLKSPTGSNRGGMSYPEMNDTPPSLVPNSSAATSEFMDSVLAPGGTNRGGMMYPETNSTPPSLMQNSDYGPIDWTPPEQPLPPPAQEWAPQAQEWVPPARKYEPHFISEVSPPPAMEWRPPAREWKPTSQPEVELMDEGPLGNNASGESGASMEAMSRLKSMADRGEVFVVYDKAGRKRPILGADAVDYIPKKGETFGIQSPEGFRQLVDNGGIHPNKFLGGRKNSGTAPIKKPIPLF